MKKKPNLRFLKKPSLPLLVATGALLAICSTEVRAQAPAVDPAATQILKRMSDYLNNLKQFSVYTQGTLEDLENSGHKIDYDVSARAIISRPNKILAERRGDLIDQNFFYDGKSLTLCNPADKVYATVPAPATIDGTLDYVRDKLGFSILISDLVYSNCFALLMQHVTNATVLGKAFIDGVKCDHVLFCRRDVDFQVWVADSGPPLPFKYVVTDTSTPALLSVTTVMSKWNLSPDVADSRFIFVPPAGDKPITFMPFLTAKGTNR